MPCMAKIRVQVASCSRKSCSEVIVEFSFVRLPGPFLLLRQIANSAIAPAGCLDLHRNLDVVLKKILNPLGGWQAGHAGRQRAHIIFHAFEDHRTSRAAELESFYAE